MSRLQKNRAKAVLFDNHFKASSVSNARRIIKARNTAAKVLNLLRYETMTVSVISNSIY